ncbi:hypothetical protein [Methylobacter sp. YRD-M1]|uniref:hypothetical protein n=1 Tax=Methylobacter sp. YRD-M1 TaxID=2911520 RepID=UPI00227D1DA7|nr:hypothetical protein [Methylobacter sp. YRD-M1]WAK01855.1 hypothetical protein LZ558_18880 [Methylobacter sp. YRD-M1]
MNHKHYFGITEKDAATLSDSIAVAQQEFNQVRSIILNSIGRGNKEFRKISTLISKLEELSKDLGVHNHAN